MRRGAKLFLLIHIFSLYMVWDLQFGYLIPFISHLAYNVLPPVFYCYCFYLWVTTGHLKLSREEKCNIKMFMWFVSIINTYNVICILVGNNTKDGYWWIKTHDGYLIFFFIFIILFNIINYISSETV